MDMEGLLFCGVVREPRGGEFDLAAT